MENTSYTDPDNGIRLITYIVTTFSEKHERQRRYLIFTPSTQWGVFITVSVPLHPESTVSVAWFFEANYYIVDNATYFDPLLGDIQTLSRSRHERSTGKPMNGFTRSFVYSLIETMFQQHGRAGRQYFLRTISENATPGKNVNLMLHGRAGRQCLLRAICENATSHLLHNGLLGDLLHLLLTPSTSMSEDTIDDAYYEAEYLGMDDSCDRYIEDCPTNPIDLMSVFVEKLA